VRNIKQQYQSVDEFPEVEIRSTYDSVQAYKMHSHSTFSIGFILSGETCLTIDNHNVILNAGDAVLIAPQCPHACNPVNDHPRSYHMMYVDTGWCVSYHIGYWCIWRYVVSINHYCDTVTVSQ